MSPWAHVFITVQSFNSIGLIFKLQVTQRSYPLKMIDGQTDGQSWVPTTPVFTVGETGKKK